MHLVGRAQAAPVSGARWVERGIAERNARHALSHQLRFPKPTAAPARACTVLRHAVLCAFAAASRSALVRLCSLFAATSMSATQPSTRHICFIRPQ